MITIWGRSSSSNVQKVLWCCSELGIEFEQTQVGREFGCNDEAWYLDMNPNGLVPTIRDGELVLWESNAILRYLCGRYDGDRLYPAALDRRAYIDQWLDWQLTIMNPAISPVFWGLIRTPEAERNMSAILVAGERLGKAWTLIDKALAGSRYLSGDTLSIADIALGNAVHRWYAFQLPDKPKLAHLDAWYSRLQEHAGFHKYIFTPTIV
ncbi:MAG TPA: glutathione S-transferase family protein [Aliidongia sp.]|nr:glutathione S-transferase family protein [Aliidongia sp.]